MTLQPLVYIGVRIDALFLAALQPGFYYDYKRGNTASRFNRYGIGFALQSRLEKRSAGLEFGLDL